MSLGSIQTSLIGLIGTALPSSVLVNARGRTGSYLRPLPVTAGGVHSECSLFHGQIWFDKDQQTSTPEVSAEVICVLDFILYLLDRFDLRRGLFSQLECIAIVINDGLAKHWKSIGFTCRV